MNHLPIEIGSIVKQVREANGFSQRYTAHSAGMSNTTLSYIEIGKRLPSLKTLYRLAQVLEVPASALLFRAECLSNFGTSTPYKGT